MWKNNFEKEKELVVATASKEGVPNANIVISLGFVNNKLLFANCQMKNTINNLKENKNVCVIGGYFRIKGVAEILSEGEYVDICKEHSDGYEVHHAILVSVDEVFDLDKGKSVDF